MVSVVLTPPATKRHAPESLCYYETADDRELAVPRPPLLKGKGGCGAYRANHAHVLI